MVNVSLNIFKAFFARISVSKALLLFNLGYSSNLLDADSSSAFYKDIAPPFPSIALHVLNKTESIKKSKPLVWVTLTNKPPPSFYAVSETNSESVKSIPSLPGSTKHAPPPL